MKRAISEIIIADCLFLFLLSLSAVFNDVIGSLIYSAAFILPICMLLFWGKKSEEGDFKISVLSSPKSLSLAAVFCFPIISAVLLIAFLTAAIMNLCGIDGGVTDLGGNVFYVIVTSALAPAVFEEILFRYLPLRRLTPYSPKLAVIYSSVLFSVVHCNLFQIPYALIAGVLFAALDVASGSVLPSIIIHFINNVLSVFFQREGENGAFLTVFLISLSALTALSLVLIFLRRKKIKNAFSDILTDKSKFIFTYSFGIYTTVMIFMAALILFY